MRKIVSFLSLTLLGTTAYHAQVGVNTQNPQGIFHIDGAKDNPETGTPTLAQQANDVSVTSMGNVGIGTNTPTNKIEINSTLSNQSGLRFSNLNSSSPAFTGTATALGVDSNGDVVSLGSENTYKGLYVINGINSNNITFGAAGSVGVINYSSTNGYGGASAATLANNGIFTATVAGVYRFDFSCAMINSNANRMEFSFRKNGTLIVQKSITGIFSNGTIGTSFFTIQTLTPGETMSVYYNNLSGTGGTLSDSNYIITRIQ